MPTLIQEGDIFSFKNTSSKEIKSLPKGIYSLQENMSLKLEKSDFVFPSKIYNNLDKIAERYLNTFNKNENKSLGVLLSGFSGNGKTLLSKILSYKSNIPTILVSKYTPNLLNFVNDINQEVIILFDEFEKNYDTEEKQNDLLPILDGVFSSKKLFVLTSNTDELNKFLLNRPGRILYHKHFEGVELDVIEEIVNDQLVNKDYKDELIEICQVIGSISVDSLIALINEMNNYSETARESLKHLNIKPQNHVYEVILLINNKKYIGSLTGHPLVSDESLIYYKKDVESWWSNESYKFSPRHFEVSFGENGKMTFNHKELEDKLIFNKINKKKFEL